MFDGLYTLSTLIWPCLPNKFESMLTYALGPHSEAVAKECGSKAFGQGGTGSQLGLDPQGHQHFRFCDGKSENLL